MKKTAAVKKAKQMTVVRAGAVTNVDVKKGMTVGGAIEAAGYRTGDGMTVKHNGRTIKKMDRIVAVGDQVSLHGQIAGA